MNKEIEKSKLKLKIFKFKKSSPSVIKKTFIEKNITPEALSTDDSTVSFSKKVGGQFNQFYYLNTNDSTVKKEEYFYSLETEYKFVQHKDIFTGLNIVRFEVV